MNMTASPIDRIRTGLAVSASLLALGVAQPALAQSPAPTGVALLPQGREDRLLAPFFVSRQPFRRSGF